VRGKPRPLALAAGLLVAGGVLFAILGIVALGGGGSHPLGPAVTAALRDAQPAASPFTGHRGVRLAVGGRCLRLVVSVTPDERRTGLRHVRDLGPYDGMLFVDDTSSRTAFTMQDTVVPLDLGLYDAEGRPVERHALVPCPASATRCPVTVPRDEYRLAVEAPAGGLPSGAVTGC
jgi:uncharacterized membrane protein (UPF0127 family)